MFYARLRVPFRARLTAQRILAPALPALLAALALASPAQAHPHVFIDADMTLVFEGQRLTAIDLQWTYDEFYSLSMIEDAGLDADHDGTPEPERLKAFAGHDVDWAAGFPGHLTAEVGGKALALAPPSAHLARYQDGRIVTAHRRPVQGQVVIDAAHPLQLRAYDPEYFVAYDTPRAPVIRGRDDCTVTRQRPKRTPEDQALLDQLAQIDAAGDSLTITSMGDVGIGFAERFEVRCGGQ